MPNIDEPRESALQESDQTKQPHPNRGFLNVGPGDDPGHVPEGRHEDALAAGEPAEPLDERGLPRHDLLVLERAQRIAADTDARDREAPTLERRRRRHLGVTGENRLRNISHVEGTPEGALEPILKRADVRHAVTGARRSARRMTLPLCGEHPDPQTERRGQACQSARYDASL